MLLSQAGKNAFASLDLVDPISSSNRDPKRKDPSPKAVQSVGDLHNPGTPPSRGVLPYQQDWWENPHLQYEGVSHYYYSLIPPGATALYRLGWFVGQNFLLFICYCKHWAYYIDVISRQRRRIMRSHKFPVSPSQNSRHSASPSPLHSWRFKAHAWVLDKIQVPFCHLWCHVFCWPPAASCSLGNRNPQPSTHFPWARTTFFPGPVSARGRRHLFSSRCEELHLSSGAQPEWTPQTFWGSCSSWCWEAYPVPISRSVCCNFKHLKPMYCGKSDWKHATRASQTQKLNFGKQFHTYQTELIFNCKYVITGQKEAPKMKFLDLLKEQAN